MRRWKRAGVWLVTIGAASTTAAQVRPAIMLTELVSVPVASLALPMVLGPACSAYDNTICHDLRGFYRPRQRHVTRASLLILATPAWGAHLTLRGGVQAPKLSLAPLITLGLMHTQALGGGGSLAIAVETSLGGALRHRPCLDAYNRAYFCANLTAWSDHPTKTVTQYNRGVKLHWRF